MGSIVRISNRFGLIGAALLAVTLGVVFVGLVQIARSLDTDAFRRTTRAVETALDTRRSVLERTIVDYAAWGEAYRHLSATTDTDWAFTRGNLGASLYTDFEINAVLVVDPAGQTTYSVTDGERSDTSLEAVLGEVGARLVAEARAAPENETVPVSSYAVYDDRPVLVAAAAFSTADDVDVTPVPGPGAVLVFVDVLDRDKLLALGERFSVPYLHTASLPYPPAHLTLPTPTGDAFVVAWSPPRPGKDLLEWVLPWLVAGTILLAGTTLVTLRSARTAARAIEKGRADLLASETRFRDIAEAASDWLWETYPDFSLRYLSDRFSVITGHDRREFEGRHLDDFLFPESGTLARLWADTSVERFPDIVCTYLTRKGESRICRLCGKPVFGADGTLNGYRGTATDITEEVAAHKQIEHLARHDAVTGLANRMMFEDYVANLIQSTRPRLTALISLGLDSFKALNDSRGYQVGDAALAEFADRLERVVPADALLARLGGDEFGIAVPIEDELQASTWSESLLRAVEQPLFLRGSEIRLGASVGIALFPKDARSPEDLLRKADIALLEAKRTKRGSYCYFSSDLNDAVIKRAQLHSDLRRAVMEQQFVLHYQPRFDAQSGDLTGVEALIRWNHPVRGMILPSDFIGEAEKTGMIDQIGACVLEKACRDIQPLAGVHVSVNVSPVQIRHPDTCFAAVQHALQESGLERSRLELELTEYALVDEIEESRDLLHRLKSEGIGLALDDFGTGYSSLGNLRGFPFDRIKLDQSFVRELETSESAKSIVEAVLTLGHALGMSITAEGVETESQLRDLVAGGCDEIQGYLWAKPMPLADLRTFVETWHRSPPVPDRQKLVAALGIR